MTQFPPPLSREESALLARQRRGRNLAMLLALLALSALFYAITFVKFHAAVGG
jgi:hypothetical protein